MDKNSKVWIAQKHTSFLNNKRLPTLSIDEVGFKVHKTELLQRENIRSAMEYLTPILRNYQSEMYCVCNDNSKDNIINRFKELTLHICNLLWIVFDFKVEDEDVQLLEVTRKNISDFCGKKASNQKIGGNIGSCINELSNAANQVNLKRYLGSAQSSIDELLALYKDPSKPYSHSFFSDFSRISFSSAFRRLQDKAQVFPLEKYDYARTRLTHTIEVMSISMQLANLSALRIGYNMSNTEKKELAFLFEKCLNCSALLHDMGNPPYGHFGEDAIKDYFADNWDNLVVKLHKEQGGKNDCKVNELKLGDCGNDYEQMKNDFLYFDGNAQSFRLASRTAQYKVGTPLDLTVAVLGSIIKYPCTSTEGIKHKKFGYFYSEKDIVDKLSCMGTYSHHLRNPLAMLLEAADDISYVTSDLNDAIKKKVLSYEDFTRELIAYKNKCNKEDFGYQFCVDFEKYYKENAEEDVPSPFEYTMQRMTNDLKIRLINQVVDVFAKQRERILDCGIYFLNKQDWDELKNEERLGENKHKEGTWLIAHGKDESDIGEYSELLDCIPEAEFVNWIKSAFFKKHIYRDVDILHNELTGHQVITFLLDAFCKAVLSLDFSIGKDGSFKLSNGDKKLFKDEKIFRLISNDFLRVFRDAINNRNCDPDTFEHVYYRLKLVVDYVSGMTDSYALEIYRILTAS